MEESKLTSGLIFQSLSSEMPWCAVVDQKLAYSFRKWLKAVNFDDSHRLSCKIVPGFVAIPVNSSFVNRFLKETEVEEAYEIEGFSFRLHRANLPRKSVKTSSNGVSCLINALACLEHAEFCWKEDLVRDLPTSWEKIDDLLLLPENCFIMKEWECLGTVLWQVVASTFGCSRVAKHGRVLDNNFRSPTGKMLLGSNNWAERVENKIRYRYDVTKCMFSRGNITEKLRIAKISCAEETVVDLFAGIGYFTLPYLVHACARLVYACEWNPDAVEALRINLTLNGVADRCIVLEGDNRQICPKGVADRVNLGLIPNSEGSWSVACAALRPDTGGILHIHSNVTSSQPETKKATLPLQLSTRFTHKSSDNSCSAVEEKLGDEKLSKVLPYSTSPENGNKKFLPGCESLSKKKEITRLGNETLDGRNTLRKTKAEWTAWALDVCQKLEQILYTQTSKDWLLTVVHIEHVKSYAPHVDHLVADIHCKPKDKEREQIIINREDKIISF